MPSFDILSESDATEVRNAVEQTNKELLTRFDFKGSDARIEQKEKELTAFADDGFKLQQLRDILIAKCAKRGVDVRFLDYGEVQKAGGDKVKQVITVRHGISAEDAKKLVKLVKESKMKAQASIQGEIVRVSSDKRDTLQAIISLVKEKIKDTPLSFENFRD